MVTELDAHNEPFVEQKVADRLRELSHKRENALAREQVTLTLTLTLIDLIECPRPGTGGEPTGNHRVAERHPTVQVGSRCRSTTRWA